MAQANVKAVITAEDKASNTIAGVGASFGKMAGAMAVGQLAANAVSKAFDVLKDKVYDSVKMAWNQVDAVQQATLALRAYEKDGDKVNKVLSELLSYARSDMGVLFNRKDLFAAAQQLKIMGANTDKLTDYVKIMSRSVGLGLSTWDGLGIVIKRVGATGKLYADDLQYLQTAGFKLDSSLSGTTQTFESLFGLLDKGIPTDALAGQTNTIKGIGIRLETAFRGIGESILGINKDTGQFIEGGLGDKFIDFLTNMRNIISSSNIQNAFSSFGKAIVNIANTISLLISWYIKLVKFEMQYIIPAFNQLKTVIENELIPSFKNLWKQISPEVQEALKKIGTVLGVVLVSSILALAEALKLTAKYMSLVNDFTAEFWGGVKDISSALKDTNNNINDFKDTIVNKLTNALDTGIDKIMEFKDRGINAFNNFLDTTKEKLQPWRKDFVGTLQSSLDDINNSLRDYNSEFIDNLKAGFSQIGEDASTFWEGFKQGFSDGFNSIITFFQELPQKIKDSFSTIIELATNWGSEFITKIGEIGSNSTQSLIDFWTNLPTKISETFTSFINTVKNFISGIPEKLKEDASNAGKGTAENLVEGAKNQMTAAETIRKIGDSIMLMIGLAIAASIFYLIDAGYRIVLHLIDGMKNAITANLNAAQWILEKIGSLNDTLYDKGRELIDGLIRGIKSKAGEIGSAVGEISSKINPLSYAKKFMGFQTGTSFAPGGMAMVGEQGPELVSLPRGSKVTPNNSVRGGGQAQTINININAGAYMGNQQDARRYADMILRAMKDNAQINGKSMNQMMVA